MTARRLVWIGSGCLLLALVLVLTGALTRPVTRVDPALLTDAPVADQTATSAWIAGGTVPTVPELGTSTMVVDALRDLHDLSQPYGVPVAGWAGPWRYVWPRDSALAAAALARTGHQADAERILTFLGQVQPDPGVFQARYLPDGSGVPDDRGEQLDGTGWALWASDQVGAETPLAQRSAFVARHRDLIDRSTRAALAQIDNTRSLPRVSSDYWEVREWRLTLATAALLHAGLQSAARLYAVAGDHDAAVAAQQGGVRLGSAIESAFGPDYPRRLGGRAATVDLGVCFFLPPYNTDRPAEAVTAWRGAPSYLMRPAGGLAPGGSWPDDSLSWTTSTSSYALTAATLGDREQAVRWLRWLDQHRTATGSLPEKVTATGQPAAVAPLAWAAAAVILTADELNRGNA